LWTYQGAAYEDVLLKYVIDVEEDTTEVQTFFREFKESLKTRFRQIEV
jgi:hypothetical protein